MRRAVRHPDCAVEADSPERCERSSRDLHRLWTGDLSRAELRELRAHLVLCDACRVEYRHGSQLASALQRERRLARLEAEREARRRWLGSLGRGAPGGAQRMWVRTLLIPALLIALLARRPPAEASARVCAEQGVYLLGQRRLASEHPPQRLARGDLVVAQEGASVKLYEGEAELRLAGPGSVLAETPRERRYRLGVGAFEVRGAHVLTTAWAVLEVEAGEARVELGLEAGRVDVLTGRARVFTAAGERLLAPGESIELGPGL